MSFFESLPLIWKGIFFGEERLKFFFGFCIVSFAIPFLLIYFSGLFVGLYVRLFIRRRYPESFKMYLDLCKTKNNDSYYKAWLKGDIDKEDSLGIALNVHDKFGKVCLAIWLVAVASVGLVALFSG
jgi:hypothetical protein